MKIKLATLFAASSLMLSGLVFADSLVDGDADAGKARALPCTACHGAEGNSSSPLWPNIAGQNAPYTLAQLQAFKSGERSDPLMSSQAMLLSDEDMANLAVYFEGLPRAVQSVGAVDTANIKLSQNDVIALGESLYRGGDKEDKTSACLACHGPGGMGNPAARYPAIAGQHADYTAKQLRDYRSGTRTTDKPIEMMHDIALTLDDKEILALSAYIQGLR